jgi:hypothetical protein
LQKIRNDFTLVQMTQFSLSDGLPCLPPRRRPPDRRGRKATAKKFSPAMLHNPLISLDSDERIQRNPRKSNSDIRGGSPQNREDQENPKRSDGLKLEPAAATEPNDATRLKATSAARVCGGESGLHRGRSFGWGEPVQSDGRFPSPTRTEVTPATSFNRAASLPTGLAPRTSINKLTIPSLGRSPNGPSASSAG